MQQALFPQDGCGLENTLIIDAFCFESMNGQDDALVEYLATTACMWNTQLASHTTDFPWISGQSLRFGVHCSDRMLHLRARCVYGVSVADEWKAIQLLLLDEVLTASEDFVFECRDVDDGQVLLIQAAEVLPQWVDDEENMGNGRYRCWIRRGKIWLLKPLHSDNNSLELSEALLRMKQNKGVVHLQQVQDAILSASQSYVETNQWHKTVAVLPESTAKALDGNASLLHQCIQKLYSPTSTISSNYAKNRYADNPDYKTAKFVWLPLRMGRTSYAMLMSAPERNGADMQWDLSLPLHGPESKLMNTAVFCGKAIEFAYQQRRMSCERIKTDNTKSASRASKWQSFLQENMIIKSPETWIDRHEKLVELCPVYETELLDTLESENQADTAAPSGSHAYLTDPPGPEFFDDTSWMQFPVDEMVGGENTSELTGMLNGVSSFLQGKSAAAEGVDRRLDTTDTLRLLHVALRSSAAELEMWLQRERDPFFRREDYDLMDPAEYDNEDDDDEDNLRLDEVMDAMDHELDARKSKPMTNNDKPMPDSVEMLSNLLHSLEAGAGSPGPVQNLLRQSGQAAPRVLPQNDEDVDG